MRAVKKPVKGSPRPAPAGSYEIIAESNGHKWMNWHGMVCCRDCGFLRREDDQNKPCQGKVGIALRSIGTAR